MARTKEDGRVGPVNNTQPNVNVRSSGQAPADAPPMSQYPDGTPDFRDPAQNPNPDYYNPNADVDQFGYQTGVDGERNYDVNVGMTGGLMDTVSRLRSSPFANNSYDVRGGTATTRDVQQNELSQVQLQKMLASGSPLMQQAATRGLAMGGSRGLMNSSMAVGASQGAMIAAAQPFAQQDASWYGKTASENMQAKNYMATENLAARIASMQAGAARDQILIDAENSGYSDIRKALIDIEAREDKQSWDSRENTTTREWQTSEREGNETWTSARDSAQQAWESGEARAGESHEAFMLRKDNEWKAREAALGRDWETGERLGTQDWETSERLGTQDWQTSEREGNETWTSARDSAQQAWQSGEARAGESHQAFMQRKDFEWKSAEAALGRDWQTGERIGGEDHAAVQAELNRLWTTSENIASDTLSWATSVLDASTRLGMSRAETQSSMYNAIMMNDNPKFTAYERSAAVAKLDAFMDEIFGPITDEFPGDYDPSRGVPPPHDPPSTPGWGPPDTTAPGDDTGGDDTGGGDTPGDDNGGGGTGGGDGKDTGGGATRPHSSLTSQQGVSVTETDGLLPPF